MLIDATRIEYLRKKAVDYAEGGDAHWAENVMELLRVVTWLQTKVKPADQLRAVPFNVLCLGALFKYPSLEDSRVWVKIGHNEIAEWDVSKVADDWKGQSARSFATEEDTNSLARIIDLIS